MKSEAGIETLLSALYQAIPMGAFNSSDQATSYACGNQGDVSYGPGGIPSFWNYVTMRDVNVFIKSLDEVKEKGIISESRYKDLLGEARFIRAYYYFASVSSYGGVPIVTEPLDDQFDGNENAGLYVKRSTEKESWDFVLAELDEAISLLPEKALGTYRANKYVAAALKSRVALFAASVSRYWQNAAIPDSYTAVEKKLTYMDASYAADYYKQAISAAEIVINSGVYSLYGANPSSVEQAVTNLTDLFQERKSSEWIFGKSYMDGVSTTTNGFDVPNSPNQAHGSNSSYWSFGRYAVTPAYVDLCDNYDNAYRRVDGTVKTVKDGNESKIVSMIHTTVGINQINASMDNYLKYDNVTDAFQNKDARFQAWVIYPGCTFRNTEIVIQGGLRKRDGSIAIYDLNAHDVLPDGTEVYGLGGKTAADCSGFYARGNTNDGSHYTTGFGIRKFLNPTTKVAYSQNPWYDIRYAEVLLNYCEAQVELNGTNAGKSKEYLNEIRHRAYWQDDVDATLDNVLKERSIELAFENDEVATMTRRRAFYNSSRDGATEASRRHALVPVRDANDGKYFFVRAYFFKEDTDRAAVSIDSKNYYKSIPNYVINDLIANPVQE